MSASNESNFQPAPTPGFQAPPPPPMPKEEPKGARPMKLLIAGIAVFVVGLILVLLTVVKVAAGTVIPGIAFCIVGLALVGLAFVRVPAIPEKEGPLSFVEKLTGIFFEPSRVFRNLREHPHWIGAFVIICVLTAAYNIAFIRRITPERIVDHTIQKMSEIGPPFAPPPERLEAARNQQLQSLKNPVQRAAGVFGSFAGLFLLSAFVAALSMLGILIFGGRINYWQALSVTLWSGVPVIIIQKVLGLVILYLKSPDDLHPILNQETTLQDNLGLLLTPSQHPVFFAMASTVGLTAFYHLWLRAKGLHLGATRASGSAGWGVAIMLWVLMLILVTIGAALFSGFIS